MFRFHNCLRRPMEDFDPTRSRVNVPILAVVHRHARRAIFGGLATAAWREIGTLRRSDLSCEITSLPDLFKCLGRNIPEFCPSHLPAAFKYVAWAFEIQARVHVPEGIDKTVVTPRQAHSIATARIQVISSVTTKLRIVPIEGRYLFII